MAVLCVAVIVLTSSPAAGSFKRCGVLMGETSRPLHCRTRLYNVHFQDIKSTDPYEQKPHNQGLKSLQGCREDSGISPAVPGD